MNWMSFFRRKRLEDELEDEIRSHLTIDVQQRIERGEQIEDALANARREFGNIALVKEAARDVWGWKWLEEIRQDLRYAIRTLSRARSFSFVVLATLTLGIGANTAVFSVINTVLLRPLKAADPSTLVRFVTTFGTASGQAAFAQDLEIWKQQTSVFDDVAAHRLEFANLTGEGTPEQIPVARVTAEFFRLFRAPVLYGRTFTPEEDRPKGPAVAVLSHGVWVRRFGSDARIIGQKVSVGSTPHVVIGILGPAFETEQFEPKPDVWVPFQIELGRKDGGNMFLVTARLKRSVTIDQANARLAVALAAHPERFGNEYKTPVGWTVQSLPDAMASNVRTSFNLLLATVCLVLLIACVNVANLQLVRADVRRREMAIRTAIGANRRRVARQLLTETFLLWSGGGAIGLLLGFFASKGLVAMYPSRNPFNILNFGSSIPRIGENGSAVTLDWRVLVFTLLVTLLTGLFFGLLPALRVLRADPYTELKQTGGSSSIGRHANRGRFVLVVGEVALALMLLIGAALLIRTSIALTQVRPGFDSHNVLTMRMSVTGTRFERRDGIGQLTRDGIQRIRALPGIVSASTACCMPLETVWQLSFIVQERPLTGFYHGFAGWTFVSPGYFDVFRIPIVRGRDFTDRDDASAPAVVIINEAMARRFWPDSDPLYDHLIIGRTVRPEYDKDPVRQIIGIVGDVRDTGLRREPRPAMYVPVAQVPDGVTALNVRLLPIVWIMRTRGAPYALNTQIQKELLQASGGLPVTRVRSMDEVVMESTALTRFNTRLMSLFAALALILAAVGVYGLLTYSVEQRAHEMGVRLALGATAGQVANLVVAQGSALAFIGLTVGTIGAFSLSRFLSPFLFGVKAHDPLVFITAPIALTVAALLAVWPPARRASRIDPATLLRYD